MRINLDIDLLRTLVAFADTGSFKGAAQLVFRSQPAISMQMKKLEDLAGHSLFEKRGRELILTDAGRQLALHARKVLKLHDKVVDELHGEKIEGKIRIGIPDNYAPLILPLIFEQFSTRYREISLDIRSNTTPILQKMLDAGELDLAILATDEPSDEDLVLRREPIVWVTSSANSHHTSRPLTLALYSDDSPVYRATMRSLEKLGANDDELLTFRVALESKNSTVLTTAAK